MHLNSGSPRLRNEHLKTPVNQELTRAYRTPTESSLCAKMGDSNNNNNHGVSYLYWILIAGPVCRIVPLLQEAFMEHAELTVSFSLLLAQHPTAVKPCLFFLQNVFWVDGKLHGPEAENAPL